MKVGFKFKYIKNGNVDRETFTFLKNESQKIILSKKSWKTFLSQNRAKLDIVLAKFSLKHKQNFLKINRDGSFMPGICHMIIHFADTDYIDQKACPGLEKDDKNSSFNNKKNKQKENGNKLSCTSISSDPSSPVEIYINVDNCFAPFQRALERDGLVSETMVKKRYPLFAKKEDRFSRYLEYVVMHEVGHALGRDHFLPQNPENISLNKNTPAPVMMQQTKGLYGYEVNTWPLFFE